MKNKENGFTLIEIMIVIFLISIVSATILGIYNNALRSSNVEKDFINMQQNLRASLYILSRDIRMAGYKGESPVIRNVGITAANSTSLSYTMINDVDGIDNDGDGAPDSADGDGDISTITYSLSGTELLRTIDISAPHGTSQQVATGIESIEFFYTYADGTSSLAPSVDQLNTGQIDSIQITLLATGDYADTKLGDREIQYDTTPGGDVTWKFSDNRHRQMVTTRVFCRNIF